MKSCAIAICKRSAGKLNRIFSIVLVADFNLDCLFSPSSPPLISSFPFGLPYVEVYPTRHQEVAHRSIWGSIDLQTNDLFREYPIILAAQVRRDGRKNQCDLSYGSRLTVWATKPRAISSQRQARCNHQDYRPRRLRQVLWYSSITRQHFILQFSSVLHFQCQLPETEVSRSKSTAVTSDLGLQAGNLNKFEKFHGFLIYAILWCIQVVEKSSYI